MNELKDTFARTVHDEPPVRATTESIVARGRSRRRRQSAVAAIGGIATAGLVVGAVVALPRATAPNPVTMAGASGTASASESKPTSDADLLASDPHIAAVKASQAAALAAMVVGVQKQLEAAGYQVIETRTKLGMLEDLSAAQPWGQYVVDDRVTRNGKEGEVFLRVGFWWREPLPKECSAQYVNCSVEQLSDGRVALFADNDAKEVGGVLRSLDLSSPDIVIQSLGQDGALVVPDDVLLAVAQDDSLDISHVLTLTDEELQQVQQHNAGSASDKAAQDVKSADTVKSEAAKG
jgi:hypothetical protein